MVPLEVLTEPRLATADPADTASDWRFLLPLEVHSRVLDLTGRDDVALAVAADVAEVTSARPTPEAADALGEAARAAGLRNVLGVVATPASPPASGAPFDVILLHDAAPREGTSLLPLLRVRLVPDGVLWIAGTGRGRDTAAWERALRRAGLTPRSTWALLPDADAPRDIVPLEREMVRALAARLPGPGAAPLLGVMARGARRLDLARHLVPSFGIVAQAASARR